MRPICLFFAASMLVFSFPASAQEERADQMANSSVGVVGQRQDLEQAPENIKPLAAVTSRVQNRVQSRIRNRIDRDYDPQANARSPFLVAEQQARAAGKPRRR